MSSTYLYSNILSFTFKHLQTVAFLSNSRTTVALYFAKVNSLQVELEAEVSTLSTSSILLTTQVWLSQQQVSSCGMKEWAMFKQQAYLLELSPKTKNTHLYEECIAGEMYRAPIPESLQPGAEDLLDLIHTMLQAHLQ